ncbi:hypothetical protein [Lentiprolixibacter aurantiacus]|uniref:Uncharacterized protein n=1 Tax=Lentiprolixibacter aurantiacus TaxID=2993939 RepID=A0AAE3MP35_9FLAO|nr:hypothetical protein [Lentiprolixibacter aurantiacus]MCX2720397.1 hypothetical protein [Lentiprolixibacter aurantiacus]
MQVKTRYRYWRMRRIKDPRQRLYASLLITATGILLIRTWHMVMEEQNFEILVGWVYGLLILEFMLSIGCLLAALRWFVLSKWQYASTAMKLGVWAVMLHAIRVIILVSARNDLWKNFDLLPEYRPSYTIDQFWLYFSIGFAVVALTGVYIVWRLWLRVKGKYDHFF